MGKYTRITTVVAAGTCDFTERKASSSNAAGPSVTTSNRSPFAARYAESFVSAIPMSCEPRPENPAFFNAVEYAAAASAELALVVRSSE